MNARAIVAVCLAAGAMLLSACYMSERLLLDSKAAARPLATGRHQAQGSSTETLDITLEADGWYRLNREKGRLLFNRLGEETGARYVFAYGSPGGYTYGLAERRGDRLVFDLPQCDLGPARDAAIAHGVGAPQRGAMAPVCWFDRRSDLVAALDEFSRRPGAEAEKASLPAAAD